MEKKNVPQLRFKEFEDEWEEKSLNNYLEVTNEKNSNNQFGKEKVLSVSGEYGVVNQIAFQGRSFAGESLINYRVSDVGTVIYTKSPLNANPYGIIKANKFEKGIVSVLYAVYKTKYSDSNFIQTYFDWDYRLNKYLRTLVNKGAKNTLLISDSEALEGNVKFPKQIEQQKIGLFLTNIDSLIQTKTKKLEALKSVKKSLLQKCFPKEGEKVPQMRFEGFSGDWEEKEIKDFSTVKDGTHATHQRIKKGYLLLSAKNVLDNELYISNDESFISEEDYLHITSNGFPKKGDILVSCVGSIGRCCIFNTNDKIAFQRSVIFIRSQNIDTQFIVSAFQSDFVQKQISMLINASTIGGLYIGAVESLIIIKPKSIAEQQKIGQLFSKYDSLISLQQKEIENLKTIKKSLLQKMFI